MNGDGEGIGRGEGEDVHGEADLGVNRALRRSPAGHVREAHPHLAVRVLPVQEERARGRVELRSGGLEV